MNNNKNPIITTDDGLNVFFNIQDVINDIVSKETASTEYHTISEFYKPNLIRSAVNQLDIPYKQKLLDNLTGIQDFFSKYQNSPLGVTRRKIINDNAAKKLNISQYLSSKPETILLNQRPANDTRQEYTKVFIDNVTDATKIANKPLTTYRLINKKGLTRAVKNLQPNDYKELLVPMIIASPDNNPEKLKTFWQDLIKLYDTCGITGVNNQTSPPSGVTKEHIEFLEALSHTLYIVFDTNKPPSEGASRSVVNIKDPDNHRYIGRPSTTSFIDMVEGVVNGRELKNLGKIYRNKDERKAEGGFLAHIDNPQEALPFIDNTDQQLKAKFMANSVALAVDAVTALQGYKRDNPNNKGYIKIKDLAMYIKRYADDIKTKGSLRPQYRKAILNGLTIAQLMGADYIVDKNKKTEVTKWRKIYLIDRITDFETNKQGDVVAIRTDFTADYKASLTYNLGVVLDGIQNLKTPEIKLLATYISDRQVAKQNDTIEGKPVTSNADTLCSKAGITDQNLTHRYSTLTKMLNELQKEGVAVGKWITKAQGNTITGYNPDSQTIYIYPTKNVQLAYTTKEHSKAVRAGYKQEQKARLRALKKYAKEYTNLDVLATEMHITRIELNKLLAGQEPITYALLKRIEIDLVTK